MYFVFIHLYFFIVSIFYSVQSLLGIDPGVATIISAYEVVSIGKPQVSLTAPNHDNFAPVSLTLI